MHYYCSSAATASWSFGRLGKLHQGKTAAVRYSVHAGRMAWSWFDMVDREQLAWR